MFWTSNVLGKSKECGTAGQHWGGTASSIGPTAIGCLRTMLVFLLILPSAKRTRLEPGQHRHLLASPVIVCTTKAFCH